MEERIDFVKGRPLYRLGLGFHLVAERFDRVAAHIRDVTNRGAAIG